MKLLFLLACLLAASGCVTSGLRVQFVADEKLKFDATKYRDDAAVVLYRADKTELVQSGSDAVTHNLRHEVIAVQGEGAFDLAEIRVPIMKSWKVIEFKARVLQPDGTQQHFDGSQLLSDSGGKDEKDLNAKFFRFPDVRLGSVLEFGWVVESPGLWNSDEQDTLGEFPVREYQFELTAAAPLVLETIEFNGGSPISGRSLADGRHQLLFDLKDLPRRRKADYAPHWTFTEPRWAWRAVAYKTRAYSIDWLRDWKDVVAGRGKSFFVDREFEQGLDEKLDVTGCRDLNCKASRALSTLVKRTTTRGVKWNREERLGAALASGKASVVERALLLKYWLEKEGLDVWLAYGTAKLGQQASPTFPRFGQFDRLFVHLPVQPGVPRPLTLDAACDACAVGQISSAYQGTPIYAFKSKPEVSQVDTEGRWVFLNQDDAPPQQLSVRHDARLEADGTVRDDSTLKATGARAEDQVELQRNKKAHALLQAERGRVFEVSPAASVNSASWGACGPAACEWSSKAEYPLEAKRDGTRWLVPTTFLRPLWEGVFEAPDRELDLHFDESDRVTEVVELSVPDSLELVDVPRPVTLKLENLSIEVKVEKTPRGARLERTATRLVGVVSRRDYDAVRAAIETFRRGRRQVLVFAPRGVATAQ